MEVNGLLLTAVALPRAENPQLGGTTAGLGRLEEDKNIVPFPGTETRIVLPAAPAPSLNQLSYTQD